MPAPRAVPARLAVAASVAALAVCVLLDAAVARGAARLPEAIRALAGSLAWPGDARVLLGLCLLAALVTACRAGPVVLLRLAVTAALSVAVAGAAAALLALLAGREGPGSLAAAGPFAFDLLSASGSFPAASAAATGALAASVARAMPRHAVPAWSIAAVLAGAGVAAGWHFASDAVAGLLIGVLVSRHVLAAAFDSGRLPPRSDPVWHALVVAPKRSRGFGPFRLAPSPAANALAWATLAALIAFLSVPSLDLAVSRLFWMPDGGFALAGRADLQTLRQVFIRAVQLSALATAILLLLALRLGARLRIGWRVWAFCAGAFVLGPGLLTNAVLKTHWGRARPADVTAFGGDAAYTAPFEMADECARNCSFVSGEGSGIAMLAVLVTVLAWPRLGRGGVAAIWAVAGIGMSLRIATGRHFLSDTVLAGLLMGFVAVALYHALRIAQHREAVTSAALRADLLASARYLAGGPRRMPSLTRDVVTLSGAVRRVGADMWALGGAAATPRRRRRP